jgi:hypothetical protein
MKQMNGDMKFTTAGDMMKEENGFRRLQERLREEGWYVGWNHYCCQSCAWMDVPDNFEDGTKVDLSKVLFNHSQDCEFEIDCPYDVIEEEEKWDEWQEQYEEALENDTLKEFLGDDYLPEGLLYEGSFICCPPEMQSYSMFCFDGSKKGVQNLKEILPIIEECGCEWSWDQTGKQRIEISW